MEQKCRRYLYEGTPTHRPELLLDSDFAIISRYQAEYRGLVQYYLLASDVHALGQLHHAMQMSLLQTLAAKHRSTVSAMVRKHKATAMTATGPMTCLRVTIDRDAGRPPLVAQFGGIPLRRKPLATLTDSTHPHGSIPDGRRGQTAPRRSLRTVRGHRHMPGPPHPQARHSAPTGQAGQTRLGAADDRAPP